MPRAILDAERRRHLDEPWPQGESWREAVARVTGCLAELPTVYAGKRVLVIGHVATRWALDHRANGIELAELLAEDFAWQEGWEYSLPAGLTASGPP
jgi:2,3-bisphosphoglycerate-dependent phosphoglycerate mutase